MRMRTAKRVTRAARTRHLQTHLQFSRGSSMTMSFVQLLKRDGFLRLWRGAPALLVACIPSHAAYFSAYELGKEKFGANLAGHHPIAAASAGALATMLHDAVMTPMDVVKQRLQLGYYRGVGHCVRTMLREEGAGAFFRSYTTTLVMNMPYAGVVVAANESLKKVLAPFTGSTTMATYLLSGAGAGALAAAVTCPLDVLKTRLQTESLFTEAAAHGPLEGGSGPAAAASTAASPSTTSSTSAATSATSGTAGNASNNSGKLFVGDAGARLPRGALPTHVQAQVALLYTSPEAHARKAGPSTAAATAAGSAQAGAASAARAASASAIAVARAIWREEGAGAFFKGVRARMAVHTPSGAISWGSYELIKSALVAASASSAPSSSSSSSGGLR